MRAARVRRWLARVTRPTRMRPPLRRQIRGGAANRLEAWLRIVGDDRDVRRNNFTLAQDRDVAIDTQHFCHLLLECLVAAFEVVADLGWLHFVLVEDLADRSLREACQAWMPCYLGRLPDVSRQQPRGPKLVRVSHLRRLAAGQRHHPCAGVIGNRRLLARPRAVVERRHHAQSHSTVQASLHSLMGHADRFTDRVGRRIGVIGQQDACPLDPTGPLRAPSGDRLHFDQVSCCHRELDGPSRCCHLPLPSSVRSRQTTTYGATMGIGHNRSAPWNRCTRQLSQRCCRLASGPVQERGRCIDGWSRFDHPGSNPVRRHPAF